MAELKGEIIAGVLGQWASGRTTAARRLISCLRGEDDAALEEMFRGG